MPVLHCVVAVRAGVEAKGQWFVATGRCAVRLRAEMHACAGQCCPRTREIKSPHGRARAVRLAALHSVMSTNVLRVCATPDDSFWEVDSEAGSSDNPLFRKIEEHGGNYTLPCSRLGQSPRETWPPEEHTDFPITGFCAELLLSVVANMGTNWDCVVSFLPTYTSALYATTKQHLCDVAYVPFGVTAARAYCGSFPTPAGVQPCPDYDPNVTWATAAAPEACCADYNYPMVSVLQSVFASHQPSRVVALPSCNGGRCQSVRCRCGRSARCAVVVLGRLPSCARVPCMMLPCLCCGRTCA